MKPIASALKIYSGEGRIVALLVGMMLVTSAGGGIGAASVDALFFARFGVELLPYVYTILGLVTFANLMVMTVLLGRVPRLRLFFWIPLVLSALVLAARLLLALNLRWFYPVLYVGKDVLFALQGVFLWGMASAFLDTRQAKRLFPLLTAGAIGGIALGSFVTPLLVGFLGAENLLIIWAVGLLLASLFVQRLISDLPASVAAPARVGMRSKKPLSAFFAELRQGYQYTRGSRLMRLWSIAAVLFSILWFSLLLPFSRSATAQFGSAESLAGFFGLFQGTQTAIALVISLFLANRLFARFGLINMLLAYPLIYLAGFAALALFSPFAAIAAFRFIQLSWSQSVAEPAWQVTMNTVPEARRDQVRAFLSAVPGQAGIVISGLILILGDRALQPSQLYLIGLGVAVLCLLVVWRSKQAYAAALTDALLSGRPHVFHAESEPFDGYRHDPAMLETVLRGLTHQDPGIRRLSAELLGQLPGDSQTAALIEALEDPEEEVRIAAVYALAKLKSPGSPAAIIGLQNDPEVEVRHAVASALSGLAEHSPQVVEALSRMLDDPDASVKSHAAAAMVRNGESDLVETLLIPMAGQSDEHARAHAIIALGACLAASQTPPGRVLKVIRQALKDPYPEVRSAACAALRQASPEEVELLIQALGDPNSSVQESAAHSLGLIGDPALEATLAALEQPERIDGALMALNNLPLESAAEEMEHIVTNKVRQSLRDLSLARGLNPNGNERLFLLADSLRARAEQRALEAMKIAALFGDRQATSLAIENLASHQSGQTAYALEVLESVPWVEMIRPVFQLWERGSDPEHASQMAWVDILADADAWVRACGVFAAAISPDSHLLACLKRLAQHDPDELVRETAGLAVNGGAMEKLHRLSVMERILFLRQVPLFASLAAVDLKQVAAIAMERSYAEGESLARQGEMGMEMFIILSGIVRVLVEPGIELTRRSMGDYVGEMAIISSQPRMASLVAVDDVRTLCIEQKEFESILRERADASLAVIRVLCQRLRERPIIKEYVE